MPLEIEITGDFSYEGFSRDLGRLESKTITVGVLGRSGSEMQKLATIHELGARITVTDKVRNFFKAVGFPLKASTTQIIIPERAPLRRTADSAAVQSMLVREFEDGIDAYLGGQSTIDMILEAVGAALAAAVKDQIADGLEPENHPMTILLKGSAKPLVNTGRLINAYTHEVD